MNNNIFTLFARYWPTVLTGVFIMFLAVLWSAHMYLSWQDWFKARQSVSAPAPTATPVTVPIQTPVPKNDCVVIDGVSICDRPSFGLQPICGLNGHSIHHAHNLRAPKPEARKALRWMSEHIGISSNFKLLAGDFSKKTIAFATLHKGERHIIFDAKENFLAGKGKLHWRDLGVLAHEIGHLIAGHVVINNISNHERELEADKFAGFILAKLGASEHQATGWTRILSDKASKTHPARAKRKEAARQGWAQAQRLKQADY